MQHPRQCAPPHPPFRGFTTAAPGDTWPVGLLSSFIALNMLLDLSNLLHKTTEWQSAHVLLQIGVFVMQTNR